MPPSRLVIPPAPAGAVAEIESALGVSRVTAAALVRRGLGDPEAARAFLALEGPQHDPLLLGDMLAAVDAIVAAMADGRRIVIHGDYDADGICATAVACEALTALGADVEPFLPSRFDEGYGLAVETVERLHAAGCGLLVTVDCGITAVDAVARARELGLPIVITDHHRPGPELPDCPLVVTRGRGDYPFPELCGSGVAFKLAQAVAIRLEADPALLDRSLDLVAVATIADVVPLVGENRGLVRAGLRRLRSGGRIGLDALLGVAKVDRQRAGAGEIAFRVAPRINACGRLGHPAEALELLLTDDPVRARTLANRLDELNRERQQVEDGILRGALEQFEALPEERRNARGLVLWDAAWHVGVVGIVASRLVERLRRPVVLIAVEGDQARGSGRSLPAFDLHAGLGATSEHLLGYGGHRLAAGLSIETARLEAFAAAFAAHADAVLEDGDLVPSQRVDAVASLGDVSLTLADELSQLEPFGLGNPGVAVLLPGIELADPRSMGATGKHLRYVVRSSAGSCRVVSWGAGADPPEPGRYDLVCRVERNDWNGSSVVQLVARELAPVAAVLPLPAGLCTAGCDTGCADRAAPIARPLPMLPERTPVLPEAAAATAPIAELVRLLATGEGLLVVGDVGRRRGLARHVLHPDRGGLDGALLFSRRCSDAALDGRAQLLQEGRWLGFVDAAVLARHPDLLAAFAHVAVLDPVADAAAAAVLANPPEGVDVTVLVGPAELARALRTHDARTPRAIAAAVWRALETPTNDADLLDRCAATGPDAPDGEEIGWALDVLAAAGLVARDDGAWSRVVGAPHADLGALAAFRDREAAHAAGRAVLAPSAVPLAVAV